MHYYAGMSNRCGFIDVIDEDTLIKAQVSKDDFIKMLFTGLIKPNNEKDLRITTRYSVYDVSSVSLNRAKFMLNDTIGIDLRDGHMVESHYLLYFVSNCKDSWRNRNRSWNNFGVYIFYIGSKLCVWYKDCLHEIESLTGFALTFLGLYIENGDMYCRCAYNQAVEYFDFHICGRSINHLNVKLFAVPCSIGSVKRRLLLEEVEDYQWGVSKYTLVETQKSNLTL